MPIEWPGSIPDPHRTFLRSAIERLQRDLRIVGVAAGGSFLTDSMDEFSDLDLVIAVDPDHMAEVMRDRPEIAGSLGPLVGMCTGEHVGEPRLLICLYAGTPPLHVDLKFVALSDASRRVEDPAILWEREGRLTAALSNGTATYPMPDRQWIEDRFWIWIHYAAAKIGRGEIFEALEGLSFLRTVVLGPLALLNSGARSAGVRKLEQEAPELIPSLEATVARYDPIDCIRALRECVVLYRSLRDESGGVILRKSAEEASMHYLSEIRKRKAGMAG